MKKLILFTTLLISFLGLAQDGYKLSPEQYKDIVKKTTQLDSLFAKEFSDKIAETAKTSLVFEKIRNNKRALIFYYDNKDLTPEEKETQELKGCESCLKVVFLKTDKGLKLSEVTGLYSDLFPTWEREFLQGVNPEQLNESYQYREVKSLECNITFRESDKFWKIYNWN